MQKPQTNPTLTSICVACLLGMTLSHPALSQTKAGENAQALLEEARKAETDRKLAAKQTEMDRLKEDLSKGKEQADGLQKSIDAVSSSVTEATGKLDQLTAQRRRMTQTLEAVALQIEAERLKVDGLKLLKIAQTKSREALAKRNEEMDLRISVSAAEMRLLSLKSLPAGAQPDVKEKGAKRPPTVAEMRKKLLQAERDASIAGSNAREAMQAATARLQQADAAAARAKKKAAEIAPGENKGLSSDSDPLDLSAALPGPNDVPAERVAAKAKL